MSEEQQSTKADKVRLGIIGCGNISNCHVKNVTNGKVPNCEITAVCDVNAHAMQRFDAYEQFTDHKALMASGLVDAILVCTPHYQHIPIAIDAIEAGVHVLVEKPLGAHVADCQRVIDAYESGRAKISFSARCLISVAIPNISNYANSSTAVNSAHPSRLLDHHRLVPQRYLLRQRRLARHLGR